MTTPRAGNWMTMLEKNVPELFKQISGVRESVQKDGALSAKNKILMMMLGDALLGHADGVANIARQARSLGASEAEISETVAVAFLMGGLPGLVTAANAFRE